MITETEIHTCPCGFTWQHGLSGQHECSPFYREQIRALGLREASLITENAALKNAVAGIFEELYGKSFHINRKHINGVPGKHGNWFDQKDLNPVTPVTDAAIAEFKAQAAEYFAEQIHTQIWSEEESEGICAALDALEIIATNLRAGRK